MNESHLRNTQTPLSHSGTVDRKRGIIEFDLGAGFVI